MSRNDSVTIITRTMAETCPKDLENIEINLIIRDNDKNTNTPKLATIKNSSITDISKKLWWNEQCQLRTEERNAEREGYLPLEESRFMGMILEVIKRFRIYGHDPCCKI